MIGPLDTRIVIGPNASMSPVLALRFLAASAILAFGIAVWLAFLGFWPILPFAGLEVGALAAALWVSLRRNRYREVLRFEGDLIRVEMGTIAVAGGRGAHSVTELPRGWTRVLLEEGTHRNSPTRLLLMCSGRRVRVGACLTDEEREALAGRLRGLTGNAWVHAQMTAVTEPSMGQRVQNRS